jgi:hypothetical protein
LAQCIDSRDAQNFHRLEPTLMRCARSPTAQDQLPLLFLAEAAGAWLCRSSPQVFTFLDAD